MIRILSFLFAVFFISNFAQAENEKWSTKLFLNWKAEPEFGGFYAADIAKIYQKNGIKAEVIQGGAGTPTVQMLASGQAEFAIVSGDEIVVNRSNGGKVVALFTTFQKSPYAFMLRAESKIKNIKELYSSNSTVAAMKGLPFLAFLEKKYGTKKIKLVPHSGSTASFENDKNFVQQCFASAEPLVMEKKGIKTKTFLVADEGFNPYTAVLATNEDTIKNKPELVKAMVKAVREGWTEYLKNPKATHEAITKLNSTMTLEAMDGIHKVETTLIDVGDAKKSGVGIMTEARWRELSTQLKDLGLTKSEVPSSDLFKIF